MNSPKQSGTAIILALFIVGLVAVLAITMMERLSRDIRRTELLLNSIQAELYAQGSLTWAMDSLAYNWLQQKPNMAIDKLPLSSPVKKLENYTISSTIYDAQAYFNLNNLNHEEWAAAFKRLLQIIDPRLNPDNAQQLTLSIENWLSPLSKNREDDAYYPKLAQPYSAPHHPMASLSELRLVRGITAELYTKLLPYVIALPENSPININTAPASLLQSLSPTLSAEEAKTLRLYPLFNSVAEFLAKDLVRQQAFQENKLTVNSQYFLIQTGVRKGEQQVVLSTLVQRVIKNSKPVMLVLWQTKGGL